MVNVALLQARPSNSESGFASTQCMGLQQMICRKGTAQERIENCLLDGGAGCRRQRMRLFLSLSQEGSRNLMQSTCRCQTPDVQPFHD